jgi:hypothetical protein
MMYKGAYFYHLEWPVDSVVENPNEPIFRLQKVASSAICHLFGTNLAILKPHYSHKPLSSRRGYR